MQTKRIILEPSNLEETSYIVYQNYKAFIRMFVVNRPTDAELRFVPKLIDKVITYKNMNIAYCVQRQSDETVYFAYEITQSVHKALLSDYVIKKLAIEYECDREMFNNEDWSQAHKLKRAVAQDVFNEFSQQDFRACVDRVLKLTFIWDKLDECFTQNHTLSNLI